MQNISITSLIFLICCCCIQDLPVQGIANVHQRELFDIGPSFHFSGAFMWLVAFLISVNAKLVLLAIFWKNIMLWTCQYANGCLHKIVGAQSVSMLSSQQLISWLKLFDLVQNILLYQSDNPHPMGLRWGLLLLLCCQLLVWEGSWIYYSHFLWALHVTSSRIVASSIPPVHILYRYLLLSRLYLPRHSYGWAIINVFESLYYFQLIICTDPWSTPVSLDCWD